MFKLITKCNSQGKLIYHKDSTGFEYWTEYDDNYYNIFYLNNKNQIIWRKKHIFVEFNHKIIFN
jgi:hypothetical protein